MNKKIRLRLFLALPFVLFGVFAIVYTAMWNRGAEGMKDEIAAFAAREEAAGRSFTYSAIATDGYPFTLRGKVLNTVWRTENFGVLKAEELIIATLPYNPSRIILAPRGAQSLTYDDVTYDLTSDDLRFSLERGFLAAEGRAIRAAGGNGSFSVTTLIANQQAMDETGARRIEAQIKGVVVEGEAPWAVPFFDLIAEEDSAGLGVEAFRMGIGQPGGAAPTQLKGKGHMGRAANGKVSGALELSFRNEGPLLSVLEEAGVMNADAANMGRAVLGMLTDQGTNEVTLPLTVQEGQVSLGMVKIGELPADL